MPLPRRVKVIHCAISHFADISPAKNASIVVDKGLGLPVVVLESFHIADNLKAERRNEPDKADLGGEILGSEVEPRQRVGIGIEQELFKLGIFSHVVEYILAEERRRELRDSGFFDDEQFRMLGEVLKANRPREMKIVDLEEYRARKQA